MASLSPQKVLKEIISYYKYRKKMLTDNETMATFMKRQATMAWLEAGNTINTAVMENDEYEAYYCEEVRLWLSENRREYYTSYVWEDIQDLTYTTVMTMSFEHRHIEHRKQKQEREEVIKKALSNLIMVCPKEVRNFFRLCSNKYTLLNKLIYPRIPRCVHYITLYETSDDETMRARDKLFNNYGRFGFIYYDFNGHEINPFIRDGDRRIAFD